MAESLGDDAGPYRGLCASTYDLLVPPDAVGNVAFFRELIRDAGEPALEIGCGTGRLLLQYAAAGLDVEGVDLSEEMLGICRTKAAALGVDVGLHGLLQDCGFTGIEALSGHSFDPAGPSYPSFAFVARRPADR